MRALEHILEKIIQNISQYLHGSLKIIGVWGGFVLGLALGGYTYGSPDWIRPSLKKKAVVDKF